MPQRRAKRRPVASDEASKQIEDPSAAESAVYSSLYDELWREVSAVALRKRHLGNLPVVQPAPTQAVGWTRAERKPRSHTGCCWSRGAAGFETSFTPSTGGNTLFWRSAKAAKEAPVLEGAAS